MDDAKSTSYQVARRTSPEQRQERYVGVSGRRTSPLGGGGVFVRLFKDNRVGLAIAALVGMAVVGTFILQLLDAIF